jgi:hypothetical protein
MKFISAKDTADFLSQSAPRVWVHRMLKWMIFFGELDAHVDRVTVQPYASVFEFTAELYEIAKEFIPTCNDHNPLAHLRCPMVIMRQG